MDRPEYMIIPCKYTRDDIRTCYNLETIVANDFYLYDNIKMGMNGLKKSDARAYGHLVENLVSSGYSKIPTTIGMWKHNIKIQNFVFVWIILVLNISVIKIHTLY